MAHKSHEEVKKELEEAEKKVKVGSTYSHYKHPEKLYKVIALATQETTDKLCVIYQSEDEKNSYL